ncbi:hypothetical protein SLEP1_g49010 [Rubroshorea leprosula]|uniref:AAA+ ATPase domain-containing protein n=1 Tax=Rubroshorea leprosula TaxID=152421 RepID=A0AAV5LVI6_9ROSI|nr:hypothetical protein SLEP1_g49010 [Rubroshorea leprosula]
MEAAAARNAIMEFFQNPPSPSTLFNAYASLSASLMILRSTPNPIPPPIRRFLWSKIQNYFFTYRGRSLAIIIIEESWGAERNLLFDAAKVYLPRKVSPGSLRQVKMGKIPSQKNIAVGLPEEENIVDFFRNIKVTWRLISVQTETKPGNPGNRSFPFQKWHFRLSFDEKNREEISSDYLQHVLAASTSLTQEDRELKLFTHQPHYNPRWTSAYLQHPASFDTIAMDPEMKQSIIDDLDRFLSRRDFYKRIGKAWKRGYLLYGPPGTGKSSLVVAMAKHLKYDVYDLELSSIHSNAELRNVLLSMPTKSILVIEDVDCYEEVHARSKKVKKIKNASKTLENMKIPLHLMEMGKRPACTLSGILNAIDGLWSGCGEERIFVFTTNYKDKIDPALLRPGRMDMQIELSYLKPSAFSVLAYNYLTLRDGGHPLLEEIESILQYTEVTPASVAEQLLRSDDVDVALEGVVNFLKRKKMEEVNDADDEGSAATPGNSKRMKLSEN